VIAILDYWSQTCLKPVHDYLFHVLSHIPQDCTFHQGKFKTLLDNPQGEYYSIDLIAATDRFPMKAIETVLKGKFPAP